MLQNYLTPSAYQQLLRAKAEKLKQAAVSASWQSTVVTRIPHAKQRLFIESTAKRKVIRAGRRGGKTTGISKLGVDYLTAGKRVLYAAPTEEQVDKFWREIKKALQIPLDNGALYKNETMHLIEVAGTGNRIRAKTAWDADTLRGDYADLLILDEFQLMNEDVWGVVGAPMLLDNNGDAVFIYTPPSLHSKYRTKARDPRYAAKLFQKALEDTTGRWEAFHFTSHDNPHISAEALDEITQDMTALAIRQEIEAEDMVDVPGALWKQSLIDTFRVTKEPEFTRLVIGVDPPGGQTEAGIVLAGLGVDGHGYVLDDKSLQDTPEKWSAAAVSLYHGRGADRLLGEKNFGGDMVERIIRTAPGGETVSYKNANASRGKALRAEPIAALYERGLIHHVGTFPHLENEMCSWIPNSGMNSPNRLDAAVWALSELMLNGGNTGAGALDDW